MELAAKVAATVKEASGLMSVGFKQNPTQQLLPVSRHQGAAIFDIDKIKALNFLPNPSGQVYVISGDTIQQFSQDFEGQLQTGGDVQMVRGWVKAELGVSKSAHGSMSYAQVRKHYAVGSVTMPHPLMATTHKELQALILPNMLEELNGCNDMEKAMTLVEACGPYYISSADFGAVSVVMAIKDRVSLTSSEDLATSVKADFSRLAKASVTHSTQGKTAKDSATYTVTTYAHGGNSTLIENPSEWNDSAAESPTIINYQCRHLYELVNKATHPQARSFLMAAGATFLQRQKQLVSMSRMKEFLESAEYEHFSIQHIRTGHYAGFAGRTDSLVGHTKTEDKLFPAPFKLKMESMPVRNKLEGLEKEESEPEQRDTHLTMGYGPDMSLAWGQIDQTTNLGLVQRSRPVGFLCELHSEPDEDEGCDVSLQLGNTGWYFGKMGGPYSAFRISRESPPEIFKVKSLPPRGRQ